VPHRFPPPRPHARVNVTPMIDVFMCLIIFFLIVGRLAASERSGEVRLPAATTGEHERTAHRFVVNVEIGPSTRAPPVLVVDKQTIDRATLLTMLRERLAAEPDTSVFVRADRHLPYADVWPVIETCARAGATEVRLSATEAAP